MAISITDINTTQITNTAQNKQTSATEKNATSVTTGSGSSNTSDTISFTDSGRLIQQLETKLESLPVVDADKVARVREDLNSGNLSISPDRIANKFTRYEALLEATR